MNEQIKKLAEQAGFKTNWQHEDVQAIKMARFEKFAELIVTQLVLSISTNSDGITSASDFYKYQKTFNKRLGIE